MLTFALMISLLFATVLRAQSQQQQQQARVPGSELSRENFNQVAASAAQIKTVLVEEPGLVVELKRWMAKDATDQGQIISESDLTEDAIFERLQTDVRFRSVATLLLQRYGYLVPKVNPELGTRQTTGAIGTRACEVDRPGRGTSKVASSRESPRPL